MSESYFAGAYWGCRIESAEECARRAETFFRLLFAVHLDYSRWFEKHNSVKRALQLPVELTHASFMSFFRQKKHQEGKHGFNFGAWTGHVPVNQEGGMVMFWCGTAAESTPNGALLHFPEEGPGLDRLATLSVFTGVMRAMVLAWEPDWAVATADDFRAHLTQNGLPGNFVGWMTYFSRQWGVVPALPEPVRVEPLEDLGTLVTLMPERLSSARPEHVELGRRVQQTLEAHGLLRNVVERRR